MRIVIFLSIVPPGLRDDGTVKRPTESEEA